MHKYFMVESGERVLMRMEFERTLCGEMFSISIYVRTSSCNSLYTKIISKSHKNMNEEKCKVNVLLFFVLGDQQKVDVLAHAKIIF